MRVVVETLAVSSSMLGVSLLTVSTLMSGFSATPLRPGNNRAEQMNYLKQKKKLYLLMLYFLTLGMKVIFLGITQKVSTAFY